MSSDEPSTGGSWASTEGVRRSMKANSRCDTVPERRLRSLLHVQGQRFRKDYRVDLGAIRVRIDVAFTREKLAVFVDGCFWHRCPQHGSDPRRNVDFWRQKLDANVERDRRVDAALSSSGWTVVRVWEHESPQDAAGRIMTILSLRRSEGT